MREAESDSRRYHHGDLRRALIDVARKVLESEGPSTLSLRAVAREIGVSPAAPYHHFKDKAELLGAISDEGWRSLHARMVQAKAEAANRDRLAALGGAYVAFARENPALYRVMYDAVRVKEMGEGGLRNDDGDSYSLIRQTLIEHRADPGSEDLELTAIAAWSSAHSLAKMAGFKQFQHLKDALGGEQAFLDAVLSHMGVFPTARRR